MTSQKDFLLRLVELLDRAGIPYMICGSVAASFYGTPRATNDIDLVIAPEPSQLDKLLELLRTDYYADPQAARQALRARSAFNVIDPQSGWKADLIVKRARPYSEAEFQRRQAVAAMGATFFLVAPEDAILRKLEWAKESGSERQFGDALSVALVQKDNLNKAYMQEWSRNLGLEDLMARLLAEADQRSDS